MLSFKQDGVQPLPVDMHKNNKNTYRHKKYTHSAYMYSIQNAVYILCINYE